MFYWVKEITEEQSCMMAHDNTFLWKRGLEEFVDV
jgi:hypothetical protein